ncbi:hypothetical protein FGIG_00363 [Fasciola gigantica]|uniref:Uncharacterized protein n=1 Tax=Fasciola gigantica TaxID=46835 RepID=A0A504Y5I6_FASGI|nr:hypothetical protein FGIG_00363 [Fasciola gigantica]
MSNTWDDSRPQSRTSKNTDSTEAFNQCNTAPVASPDDPHTETKTLPHETLPNETVALDRYLTKIHTNLDSRYSMPSAVVLELRRPPSLGSSKFGTSGTKRLLFNPNSLGSNRQFESDRTITQPQSSSGMQVITKRLRAEDWRKSLEKEMISLVLWFC